MYYDGWSFTLVHRHWIGCDNIGQVLTNGTISTHFLGIGGNTQGIIQDATGNLWVALSNSNSIVKVNISTGMIVPPILTLAAPSQPNAQPYGLVLDNPLIDTNIWFTQTNP